MAVREVTRHFIKLHLIPWKHHGAFQMSTCRMEAYIPLLSRNEESSIQCIRHSNTKDGLFWPPVETRHPYSSIGPTLLLKCLLLVWENNLVNFRLSIFYSIYILKPWSNGPASSRKWTQAELAKRLALAGQTARKFPHKYTRVAKKKKKQTILCFIG